MPSPAIKRRKPKAARKESTVMIRVTAAQKRVLADAAERAGLDLSSWLRALGLRAAAEVIPAGVGSDGGGSPDAPEAGASPAARRGGKGSQRAD